MLAPDAYMGNPYGHVTNQAGHAALIGIGLAMPLLWTGFPLWLVPVAVALIYAGAWEWGIQRRRWPALFDWRDSLMDTACVTAGASIVAGFVATPDGVNGYGLVTGSIAWAAWAALVFAGGLMRWRP